MIGASYYYLLVDVNSSVFYLLYQSLMGFFQVTFDNTYQATFGVLAAKQVFLVLCKSVIHKNDFVKMNYSTIC
jgi:hypothetical protein